MLYYRVREEYEIEARTCSNVRRQDSNPGLYDQDCAHMVRSLHGELPRLAVRIHFRVRVLHVRVLILNNYLNIFME